MTITIGTTVKQFPNIVGVVTAIDGDTLTIETASGWTTTGKAGSVLVISVPA